MKSEENTPLNGRRSGSPKIARKGLQILTGILLSGYLVQLVALPIIYIGLIAQSDFAMLHFLRFSDTERSICYFCPLAGAALLCRRRPYVSLGMLWGFGFQWIMLHY